ncbi:DNA polymerase Y family protein [Nocardia cyriacigeorgica]|uniref:DNA polymerase Y family protein n=1 Tax=Nocardia cyriacigeorgica TaxID=135487 RepID=UPI00189362D4|nr:DNA polymerase Y family protein [Nocardia cyriacigeorgica]MBF6343826.1 DNA polymerase Y family protein [Nocardia cyriacigeorgica]MBF6516517.1 DNA polymerase Y family protein [Nocardia cyriacigeorgica]
MTRPARVLAVWCPDWPAVAAAALGKVPASRPVAVLSANKVVACSATARADGVRRGLRRREAQARCPELYIAKADPDRDARLFEPVVAAVDAAVPGVEVLRPGLLVLGVRGAARFFGSEEAAAERLVDVVAAAGAEAQIGIADEVSTAVLAARRDTIVAPGAGADFLAPLPIGELAVEPALAAPERVELVDLLHRLGLRRVGDFAALTAAQVGSRFGADAIAAHRCARALPERPPSARTPPRDLTVELHCDPPIDRVDAAAFAGRMLATRAHAALSAAAVACTRLAVSAETAAGEQLTRVWRCAEPLTADGVADRVRWQLDGWLTHRDTGGAGGPTAAITLLRLEPVEVIPAAALQLGLWGDAGGTDARAMRALVRVQGLLGGAAVQVGVLSGGRGPAERITMVALGDEQVPAADPALPWPGRLPEPAPAVLMMNRPRVELESAGGAPVHVTERGLFSATPARLRWGGKQWELTAWAGPWPMDELWWSTGSAPTARVQVELPGPHSLLLITREGRWHVEGLYE